MDTVAPAPANPRPAGGATQATLREHNLSLVARIILGASTPMSRADVAAATALTRSTVSRLVDDLLAGGLVREVAKVGGGLGRPATPVVADDRLCALGLQVNATFLLARLVALDGTVIAEEAVDGDFVASDPAAVLPLVGACGTRVVAAAGADRTLVGTGLALPGLVRPASGTLLRAPNLGWSSVQPAPLLAAPELGPVLLGNEADCAAVTVAQPIPGRPHGPQDFIYLSGEIGIGGAAVLGGRVMRGQHGWAGEIGHVCVDPDGPPCPCGSHGCLERYAGLGALVTAAGLPATAGIDRFARACHAGDAAAVDALAAAVDALETALVSAVNLLDIPAVVLGGHLGRLADLIAPDLAARLGSRVLAGRFDGPTVRVDEHVGADAGEDRGPAATGAAITVLEGVIDRPAAWIDGIGARARG
ncbi:ROK family transcriptional regulator [Tersicoccus solisilvae]|uniref:ROK family transcriptional regulator n=1 Tax=Tersicoccus solisilvae TaxID=1882339 RepID=UPI001E59A8FF|nr:ROK family transcriptional regulator [Tersicoccus solisilvae]